MANFNFRVEKYDMFRLADSFEYWISAKSERDALDIMIKAYPEKLGYEVILIND